MPMERVDEDRQIGLARIARANEDGQGTQVHATFRDGSEVLDR